ncbi:MAG: glycosyltransferase family 2 protein [Alphaproteobacteria bacterium]|nr:MAG: glycosyltransferase family 2 protein [Alphaproteobacteria bacterium]
MLAKLWSGLRMGPRGFARLVIRYSSHGVAGEPGHAVELDEYQHWLNQRTADPVKAGAFGKVSVVMPVCDTPLEFLREAYSSVLAQTYLDWELCIHDDGSKASWVRTELERMQASDPRVKVSYGTGRSGIAAATNSALSLAQGVWVAFLDHDDVLHPAALALTAQALSRESSQIVYTDHDALDESGRRCKPYFKPDWSPDLFLAQMFMGHLVVMERALVLEVGGLRHEMDGAQDYDLILRCVAAGARISHVPEVLYHWRQHAGSTSANADSKPYAHNAGRRALQQFVDIVYPGARVDDGEYTFCYDVRYPRAHPLKLASIIIPTKDGLDLLEVCIDTIRRITVDQPYEIIVVDNGSVHEQTKRWLAGIVADPRIRVLPADVPFNWSALNNLAAREARGEVLVFLNNDTEVVQADWLVRLVELCERVDVGVCGPLLVYGDGTIQHAGVVVGMGGWADHVFKGQATVHHQHLFTSPMLRRNVLAVTGACMAIAKDKFDAIGGFDESFVVCGSDVELCLRAYERGLLNVYLADVCLIHHESKTRDPRAIPESDFVQSEIAYRQYRTNGDPFYSSNLDDMQSSPTLGTRK